MSAKIGGTLPRGDANGMGPIIQELVEQPHRFHVLLAIVDCKKVTTDHDSGEVIPTARIRRVEVVLEGDLKTAEKLLRRALESRSGRTMLPMDLEDEISMAFGKVDPRTGEMYGEDGKVDNTDPKDED